MLNYAEQCLSMKSLSTKKVDAESSTDVNKSSFVCSKSALNRFCACAKCLTDWFTFLALCAVQCAIRKSGRAVPDSLSIFFPPVCLFVCFGGLGALVGVKFWFSRNSTVSRTPTTPDYRELHLYLISVRSLKKPRHASLM